MAIFIITLNTFLMSFIVFGLAFPHNFRQVDKTQKTSSSQQVSKRSFEPWLSKYNRNMTFNIAKFGAITPFHENEMAHLYQGDIMGFGGQMVLASDGKKHFKLNRWPFGIVPYIITGNYSEDAISVIKRVMRQFAIYTCIRFVKRTSQKNYINIQSTEDSCWSFIGRVTENIAQPINMAPDCIAASTVIHEFMHTLGFIHEQSRPDRDKYITIHWENIKDEEKHSFMVDDEYYQDLGVPYDIGSVMQYDEDAFSISPDKPTITAKNGKKLGNSEGFSKSDIMEINKLYKCKRKGRKQRDAEWPINFS